MPFDLLLIFATVLVAVAIAFAVSAMVGLVFALRLQEPEVPPAGRATIHTRPPGG